MIKINIHTTRIFNSKLLAILFCCIVFSPYSYSQIMTIKSGGTNVFMSENAIVTLNGGVTIESGSSLIHETGIKSDLFISGRFFNYGTYTQNTNGLLTFVQNELDSIGGVANYSIDRIVVNKSGTNNVTLDPNTNLSINDNLRLLSGSVQLVNSELIITPTAQIYANAMNDYDLAFFDSLRCIINIGSGGDPLLGGHLVRQLPSSQTLPVDVLFPVGTPGVYTPAEINLLTGGASFSSNPRIAIKPVPQEHPMVEIEDKSLTKYWNIETEDIDLNDNGTTVQFYYNASEVEGNEGSYVVLYFSPAYNDPWGFWKINPGADNDIVDFNNKFFYSQKVDSIDGDWVAGEVVVAQATYYSRADGDWHDPNTWSKVYFGDVASTTAPNKQSDKIRIQHNVINIDSAVAPVGTLSLENGTEGRNPGKLYLNGDYEILGDSVVVELNTTIGIGHSEGVFANPTNSGQFQTSTRVFSPNAVYEFVGLGKQFTGTGIPTTVRSIVVNKVAGDTLELSKNFAITDSLIINDGTLDLASATINGNTAGRLFRMDGGEIVIRSTFPTNYVSPSFTIGRVSFDGTGNTTIPTTTTTPGVQQYFDLKIAGNTRSGNVTFPNSGQMVIRNSLDIGNLNFASNAYAFLTDGSTVRFNKNGGTQTIPTRPASPADTTVNLQYYNLILDSAGTKQLTAIGSPTFKVLNDITLNHSVEFDANNFNLEVQGDWSNQNGSTFIPGSGTLIFRSTVNLNTNNITSRDTSDNPFNNVVFAGAGIVAPLDNIKIQGNLRIDSAANFKLGNFHLSLYGNWLNNKGTFVYDNSNVHFNNNSLQTISKTIGDQNFYNLTINNNAGVNSQTVGAVGNGIIVNNNLVLENGNLRPHIGTDYRFVTVLGALTRPGSGFVDGELRKVVGTGAQNKIYEVGYNTSYTPVELDFIGTGGVSGLMGVYSDTVTTVTSPIAWTNATPTGLTPANSLIKPDKHVARQFYVNKPTAGAFVLGTNREFSLDITYIPGASPNGDIRNNADTANFDILYYTGSSWVRPYTFTTYPVMSERLSNSTKISKLKSFGTFIIGEPVLVEYFTRANGNWDLPSNWSTQSYGGSASASYPGEISNHYIANIGNGNTITLNLNVNVDSTGNEQAFVRVDSSGKALLGTNLIQGTGAFKIAKDGIVGSADADGLRLAGALGNIRTSVREYNFGNHGRSHFIYYGGNTQTQIVNNLPDTIASLVIDKSSNALTISASPAKSIVVRDSLYIDTGTFTFGSDFDLSIHGNFRRDDGTTFNPGTRTVTFTGVGSDTITNLSASPLEFYNLVLSKVENTGSVLLWDNTALNILNNLNFTTTVENKTLLDARVRPSAYVQINSGATVSNAGNSRGWVNGEMRRYIASGDAPAVEFEIGDTAIYSPFYIDFASGSGSAAGYLGAKVELGSHPYHLNMHNPSISPARVIGPKYWRFTLPSGSTFARGTRNYNVRASYAVPGDDTNVDDYACTEISFIREWTNSVDWQEMYASNGGSNDGQPFSCTDTRNLSNTPQFNYTGANAGGIGYTQANNVNLAFGNSESIGSDILLGDFIVGNQAGLINFYIFYSINDGDWTDPNNWSTVSYISTINEAATDPDPSVRGFPHRQYDNVYIGNNRSIKLNSNIGTNRLSSISILNAWAGPSVNVEATGALDLDAFVLRFNNFEAKAGSKLTVGSQYGIATSSTKSGNLLGQYNYPSVLDSINIVYSAVGNHMNLLQAVAFANRDGSSHYIERVRILDASANVIIDNFSGNSLLRSSGCVNIYPEHPAVLVAGETYTLQINPSNIRTQRKFRAWIDYNYNGAYTDSGEMLMDERSNDTTLVSVSFTVPIGTGNSSTFMRVGMRETNSNFEATDAGTGEFEDYTIKIINPNTVVTQVTGNGLPDWVASYSVHSKQPNSTVAPQKDFSIVDSLKIVSGQHLNGTRLITLLGDFINDTINGFNAGTGSVIFRGADDSEIRGSAVTSFNILRSRKNDADINLEQNAIISNSLILDSANHFHIADNINLTINQTATVTPGAGTFNANRMLATTGSMTSGSITKRFTSGTGVLRNFNFPIGVQPLFNPAFIQATANYGANASITVKQVDDRHPLRLMDSSLYHYWTISTNELTNVTADSMNLSYNDVEVVGNESIYLPGRHRIMWEINLGDNPYVDTVNNKIIVTNVDTLDGDWTAGEPLIYFNGRIFYSRVDGDWNNKLSWSNEQALKHNGPAASYFPGMIYNNDTVNIDGHLIVFRDSLHISIDSLRIGGSNPNPGQGILQLSDSPAEKILEMREMFLDEDGMITGTTPVGGRRDTIQISGNIKNNSTASVSLRNDNNNSTTIKFVGDENSLISGTGNWGRLGNIVLEKDGGLLDSLFISSPNFAVASDTTANYSIGLNSGVLSHSFPIDLYISTDGNPVNMGNNTGLHITNGSIRTRSTLTSNSSTTIVLDDGDLWVGDSPNEHFLYRTGTVLDQNFGTVRVAGAFARDLTTSEIDFNLAGSNEFFVNTVGNTSTNIGFDISNSSSSFSMSDGRIVIANAGGTTTSVADYRVSAQNGTGMIGGVIQSGDTALTPNSTIVKLSGTMPVYNLLFANNPLNAVSTQINEVNFTIKNDWTIDENHSFNLNGSTVNLAGNLINYGNFVGVPPGPTSDAWLISLNGTADQTLLSQSSPLEIYNLRLIKASGNVLLSAVGNSDLVVRNSLEFSTTNQSFIDASATNRFVELSPMVGSNPQVFRVGKGHVFGRLYRQLATGNDEVLFPVGADTLDSYRPVIFETVGAGGTVGLVGVRAYEYAHPDTASSAFNTSTNVQKYWNINTSGAFDLGARTFNTTLFFLNPQDINGGDPLFYEQYLYNPPYPPSAGVWSDLFTSAKTDTSSKSINNTTFGDFALGEPSGITFWSYNDGSWNDINTWSMSGYTTMTPATRAPNEATDIVRIGYGKTVTLPDGYQDTVRSVIVERFDGLPGSLYIVGSFNYIRGTSFILEDSCTIGLMHLNGITPSVSGFSGAVQTNIRNFGVSRFHYNSSFGSQNTGTGIPDSVKSLIIDNPGPVNKTVFMSVPGGSVVRVQDTLLIKQGTFNAGNRNLTLYGVAAVDSVVNDGKLTPTSSSVNFGGLNDKYIVIRNNSGINFNNVNILGGDVIVHRPVLNNPTRTHVYIANQLNFANPNTFFSLNDSVHLTIQNPALSSILNFGSDRFVRTSIESGFLIRAINPSLTYTFPVGSSTYYAPASFVGGAGTAGRIGVRTSPGVLALDAHRGSSGSPYASFIQRYWSIDSVSAQINGQWTFNYVDDDVYNNESDFVKIGRWRPTRERIPGVWTFPFNPPTINIAGNFFQTDAGYDYNEFTGDWTTGSVDYFRRIFYSRQSGNWTDENTWTYNPAHTGPISGAGIFPNMLQDSAIIGGGNAGVGNHVVNLDINDPILPGFESGIALGTSITNTGTLVTGNNFISADHFTMENLSSLYIGSPEGITSLGNPQGSVQSVVARSFSKNGKFYYQATTNQVTGTGLPDSVRSLTVINSGAAGLNVVTLTNDVITRDSLTIIFGILDLESNIANSAGNSHYWQESNTILRVGGTNSLETALNNYLSYNLPVDSWIDFNGTTQTISDLPLNLIQDVVLYTGGLGSIFVSNPGDKTVNGQLLVRGNMSVRNSSTLNNLQADGLYILGNVINSATIVNQGIIHLGQ
ncbi:MAG: hypothetical protein CVV22_12835 [Ignavibacteriae bacterium HGW-Ignavibacteriae-1]|nr:MAG: hypothetical protein CVV22_12835 [Ignavibacteriae bacterium HGW-Ignavibacteriae-1]